MPALVAILGVVDDKPAGTASPSDICSCVRQGYKARLSSLHTTPPVMLAAGYGVHLKGMIVGVFHFKLVL